jgi:hypothetical protein
VSIKAQIQPMFAASAHSYTLTIPACRAQTQKHRTHESLTPTPTRFGAHPANARAEVPMAACLLKLDSYPSVREPALSMRFNSRAASLRFCCSSSRTTLTLRILRKMYTASTTVMAAETPMMMFLARVPESVGWSSMRRTPR